MLRLNDPAIAFCDASAADLLHCYGRLRRALVSIKGAVGAQLYLALNWQPVGDAVGEPLAETSTPTVHAFFQWPGSTTAAVPLCLPAHQRVAAVGTEEVDALLRQWLAEGAPLAPASDAPKAAAGAARPNAALSGVPRLDEAAAFHVEPASARPGEQFMTGHWTASPVLAAPSLDELGPGALLELAGTVEALLSHGKPPMSGATVWATDPWTRDSSSAPFIHIFGRLHSDARHLVADFVTGGGLELPG